MRQIKLLSRDVDLIKTAENVDYFLSHDLERAVRTVNINIADLKSPTLDGLPRSPSFNNALEEKMIQYIDCRNIVEGFHQSYIHSNVLTQKIIKMCYLQGIDNQDVMRVLGYEHSRYAEIKRNSLNEFADRFEMQSGCPDLHVKKAETLRKQTGKKSV